MRFREVGLIGSSSSSPLSEELTLGVVIWMIDKRLKFFHDLFFGNSLSVLLLLVIILLLPPLRFDDDWTVG